MHKKTKTILCLLLVALIITGIATTNIVSAEQTTIHVDPPEIIDLALTPGETFNISVSISDVEEPGLYAYEFKLYYDNTLLEAIAWALPEGHFLTPAEGEMALYQVPASGIYHEDGYVLVAISSQGDVSKPKIGA